LAANLISLKIGLSDDPGRAFAMLVRRKSALGDETTDSGLAEREGRGGVTEPA
jgi:hypothetical protein